MGTCATGTPHARLCAWPAGSPGPGEQPLIGIDLVVLYQGNVPHKAPGFFAVGACVALPGVAWCKGGVRGWVG